MPGCCCSPFECAANQQFNQKKVAQELKRYRQKGPGPTTRLLVDGIARSAKIEGTLLDIGSRPSPRMFNPRTMSAPLPSTTSTCIS